MKINELQTTKDNEEIYNVYGHTIFQEPLLNEYSCGIDLGVFL